jgi:hypothetical protein
MTCSRRMTTMPFGGRGAMASPSAGSRANSKSFESQNEQSPLDHPAAVWTCRGSFTHRTKVLSHLVSIMAA